MSELAVLVSTPVPLVASERAARIAQAVLRRDVRHVVDVARFGSSI